MRGAPGGERRTIRFGVAGIAASVLVLAALPSAGLGSPARKGAGADKPPKVKIAHGPRVVPKHFQGDVRNLPQIGPTALGDVELPEPEAGPEKSAPVKAPPIAAPLTSMPAPDVSFAGLDFQNWGAGHPPDPVGDVGPNYYIEAVNTSVGIYNKTGTQLAAFTFDSPVHRPGHRHAVRHNNMGDPVVVYDAAADRWIVTDFAWTNINNGPYYECIAVSKTGNPVTGGWWLYAFRADDASHTWLNDYPKMGVWPDGLYMSANMFDCPTAGCGSRRFKGVRAYALNRSDLVRRRPASVVFDLSTSSSPCCPATCAERPAGRPGEHLRRQSG